MYKVLITTSSYTRSQPGSGTHSNSVVVEFENKADAYDAVHHASENSSETAGVYVTAVLLNPEPFNVGLPPMAKNLPPPPPPPARKSRYY